MRSAPPARPGRQAHALLRPRQRLQRRPACRLPGWVASLLTQLEAHEPGAISRSRRAAELARHVAAALTLPVDDAGELEHAALVSEVGRMAVPLAVLRKCGPLNEAEQRILRTRTGISECTVRLAGAGNGLDLEGVARIVRSSQERWDGLGYPDGLSGEEIPLSRRIILTCSAFTAILDGGTYGEPRSVAAARAELRSGAGTQFDPALVSVIVPAPLRPAPHSLHWSKPASADTPGTCAAAPSQLR